MRDEEFYRTKAEQEKEWNSQEPAFRAEIENHPFLLPFKEKYREMGVENLVDCIVRKKLSVGTLGRAYEKKYEDDMLQHVEYCDTLLELVLQKKLFNLQLQWRAGQIKLEGIQIADDFHSYGSDVFNCPFVEPITERELEVLKLYMKTTNFSANFGMFGASAEWQDYRQIMKKDERGDLADMPDFFEFYDGQMGTFYLLNLPDVRSPMEERYLDFYREEIKRNQMENQEKVEKENVPPPKKYFSPFDEAVERRIFSVTENEGFWQLMEAQKKQQQSNIDRSDITELIQELDEISDEEIRLPGHLTWEEGLAWALENYRLRKAAEVLDLAYEKYQMKAELRLFDETEIQKHKDRSPYRVALLKGRQLAGEPDNLDF